MSHSDILTDHECTLYPSQQSGYTFADSLCRAADHLQFNQITEELRGIHTFMRQVTAVVKHAQFDTRDGHIVANDGGWYLYWFSKILVQLKESNKTLTPAQLDNCRSRFAGKEQLMLATIRNPHDLPQRNRTITFLKGWRTILVEHHRPLIQT